MIDLGKPFGMLGSIIKDAFEIAQGSSEDVRFEFNGVQVYVSENTPLKWGYIGANKEITRTVIDGKKELDLR